MLDRAWRPERTRAIGRTHVIAHETRAYDEQAGVRLVEVRIRQNYIGDFQGSGTVRFLQTICIDGVASFVGIERYVGKLGDLRGSFVLQNTGSIVRGGPLIGNCFVVPGSGTGAFAGIRGEGGFEAVLGRDAHVHLDYWFE